MINKIKTYAPHAYACSASLIFLDSLRFKFTNAPATQIIFGKLDAWATTLGASGLFSQTGLFSQYVIGTAELIAASLLLIGILPAFRRLQTLGAVIAAAVMTGAVSFHLFTPLGIDPTNDGPGLFVMAVLVWLGALSLVIARRETVFAAARGIAGFLVPAGLPKLRTPVMIAPTTGAEVSPT